MRSLTFSKGGSGPIAAPRTRDYHFVQLDQPGKILAYALTSATLEQVHITALLAARPFLKGDDQDLNNALLDLNQRFAKAPKEIFNHLVETARRLCSAGTAGISLLEIEDGQEVFRWRALTGELAAAIGMKMARNDSPCGMVLDGRQTLLFSYPEKHFPFPAPVDPAIVEAILVPFFDHGQPVGTIWVVAHDDSRKFDLEDERVLNELSRFTSSAYGQLRLLGYVKPLRLNRNKNARLPFD